MEHRSRSWCHILRFFYCHISTSGLKSDVTIVTILRLIFHFSSYKTKMPMAVVGVGFLISSVCLFIHTLSQKAMQLGYQTRHTNVPRWFLLTHLFWDSKLQGQGHNTKKTLPAWFFALLWVLASCCSWNSGDCVWNVSGLLVQRGTCRRHGDVGYVDK